MKLKFAANISTMFTECDAFTDRFLIAKSHGFPAVECMFPFDFDIDLLKLKKNEASVELVLMNAYPGDIANVDCGLAITSDTRVFRDSIEKSIVYAKALQCKKMHVMSGKIPVWKDDVLEEYYLENLKFAADALQKEEISCLIEPVNSKTIPNYFMDHPYKAIEVIKKVNHPNLKLQLDIFHLQMITGNLTTMIDECLPFTDHIQVSQAPHRNEPMSSGEIDYGYIFSLLEKSNYKEWIGLEYKPLGSTTESLQSMKEWLI